MTIKAASNKLFKALNVAGFSKTYVQRMLPDWWADELLDTKNAQTELSLYLARMFGMKLSELLKDPPAIVFESTWHAKYKRSKQINDADIEGATALIHSIAKMANTAVTVPYVPLPQDPLVLRQEILSGPAKYLSLMSMVDYLWSKGIPTLHVSSMPEGLKKMDGMSLCIGDRPIVILSKRSRFCAWQVFILAHELAHCAMKHIGPNEVLVDYAIGENSYLLADNDTEEMAADEFAIALLNGEEAVQYISDRKINAAELAKAALLRQSTHKVDAGHVILNYAHRNNAWGIAQAALKKIDLGDARLSVNNYLFSHLDLKKLPHSSVEYLLKVTGCLNSDGV